MSKSCTRRVIAQTLLYFSAAVVTIKLANRAEAAAARDTAAERFIQTKAQQLIGVLADERLSIEGKARAFHLALDDLADVPRITNFVLGKYARTITPDQKARFSSAFRAYAEDVYRARLDDYQGETLKVTGSNVRKPGDVIVATQIGGGQIERSIPVSWRVLGGGAAWKVVDVQFKGVWLAITQQQDFVSTIDNAGGDIDVLIDQLKRGGQTSVRTRQS